jgi:hypothetical protein
MPLHLKPNHKAKVHAGRILVPHTRNNFEVWAVHSDDDGLTWSADQPVNGNVTVVSPDGPDCNRNMSYFGVEVSVGFERNTRTKSMESCLSRLLSATFCTWVQTARMQTRLSNGCRSWAGAHQEGILTRGNVVQCSAVQCRCSAVNVYPLVPVHVSSVN